ncbi:MAG: dihydroorotate dehydrogenase [Dehalococcoidales bacterium]|nr:dihydroorotate dehydrogenase [Dehalococcoidales bacterium]
MDLTVQLAPKHKTGLKLVNPVMTASGTFGYGTEYAHLFDTQRLGAVVCKGTTLEPREGNPQPRLVETAGGMLNSIGLQNIGIEALIRDKAPVWAKWRVPVIVNLAGATIEEYAMAAGRLKSVPGVSAIELNISCPNVKAGGAEFCADPVTAAKVTEAVRAATELPLIVKLAPDMSDIVNIAKAVAEAGADALTLINTLKGMAIDIVRRKPTLGNVTGGLSGPAIKPVALYMVYKVAGQVDIPIIGCGGIATGNDAIEFIMAGATAVQVGTVNFANPKAPLSVLAGIEQFLRREEISSISDIIGTARR